MRFPLSLLPCLCAVVALGGCSSVIIEKSPETGMTAIFNSKPTLVQEGVASWYKDKRTASGEKFNPMAMTAAHKKLPFGTNVRVIDLKTHKSVIVRINDRGPYVKGRIIDLTTGAARELGIFDRGLAKVRIEALQQIPLMAKPNLKPSHKSTSAQTMLAAASPAAAAPTEGQEKWYAPYTQKSPSSSWAGRRGTH